MKKNRSERVGQIVDHYKDNISGKDRKRGDMSLFLGLDPISSECLEQRDDLERTQFLGRR
jgi:hypothetical protein